MKRILKKGMIVTSLAICIMAISPGMGLNAKSNSKTYNFYTGTWHNSGEWNNKSSTYATATIYDDDGNNTKGNSRVCLLHNDAGLDSNYGCREEYLDSNKDSNQFSKSSSSLNGDVLYAQAKVWNMSKGRDYMKATLE